MTGNKIFLGVEDSQVRGNTALKTQARCTEDAVTQSYSFFNLKQSGTMPLTWARIKFKPWTSKSPTGTPCWNQCWAKSQNQGLNMLTSSRKTASTSRTVIGGGPREGLWTRTPDCCGWHCAAPLWYPEPYKSWKPSTSVHHSLPLHRGNGTSHCKLPLLWLPTMMHYSLKL